MNGARANGEGQTGDERTGEERVGNPARVNLERMLELGRRCTAWCDARPRLAWAAALSVVLLAVGWETATWPLHDYPGALWHQSPKGDDIELGQANAARAGWPELLGFWRGRMLHGHGYFRPISSWLFVGEYRLFGTEDRLWSVFSILFHGAVALLLVWALAGALPGSRARRLSTGVLAALLFGAPWLADRDVQKWVIGWWPAQPEALSLVFGLLLLGSVARYIRSGDRRWAVAAPCCFFLAICTKEMGYVAGVGACLLLARHPRRWGLLAGLAALGITHFAYRNAVLGDVALHANGFRRESLLQAPGMILNQLATDCGGAWPHAALIGLGLGAGALARRPLTDRVPLAAVTYLALGFLLFGPPWDQLFQTGASRLLGLVGLVLVLAGLARTVRRWPVAEWIGIYLAAYATTAGFPPSFPWYRYWWTVFGASVTAISLVSLWEWGLARLTSSGSHSGAEANSVSLRD